MSNASETRCPRCAAPLPPAAPEGLCPRCLGALNLATETVPTGADAPPASPQPPLTPAELAPHFPQLEIIECLGRGGMGVVYKARQRTLNRVVALKLLAPERVTDAGFAERFTREAQALARLNHSNIVTIYDFGATTPPQTPDAIPHPPFFFLLMEYVDGVNLRQAMRAGRFTPEQALAIVPPVCEALQYAHDHGIVHRDIKPENLLLDKNGRIKIADFGIAKMLGAPASSPAGASVTPADDSSAPGRRPALQSEPTQVSAAGTPGYMAPEQATAPQRVDRRADIYSLGVILYELLTGELPGAKLQPPSRKVQIDVRLDEIVLRALETKPELRFATAAEFRTQVENLADSAAGSDAVRPGEPAWFKPVGLLYVLAGLLGWLPTVASLGTHVVVEHIAVMLAATGLALLTCHRWWRWLALGCNALAVSFIVFIQLRVLGAAAFVEVSPGAPGPAGVGDAVTELAGRVPELLLLLLSFSAGIWALRRPDARAVFARPPARQREHQVFGVLAVLALAGGLLTSPPLGGWGINPVVLSLKAAGIIGLAAWCLLRGGTAAAPLRLPNAFGISLRVLVAVVVIGLALCVGFLVLAGLYRTREATTMAQRAALAAKQQARDALGSQDPSIVAPPTNSAATASPITSSIGASDNSPEAIAAAQQRGIASATRDIQAGIFRILRYGILEKTDGTETDEETGFRVQWVAGSILSNQFRAEADAYNFAMRDRYWKHEHWLRKAAAAPPVAAGAGSKLNAVTRTFPLRHKLASDMVDDLRQILLGRSGHESKPAANNQEILVTAPPEVLTRAQTFITVTDWPDTITRGPNYEYPRQTVLRAARSFFYACALEDATEAISKLLSLHVLAQLKGDTKSEHYFNYNIGGVPDPEWEKSLRMDWPGKQEAIQRLVREWNRYPLKRLTEESGIAIGFGVKHFCSVAFAGAPKEFYQVTLEPDRTKPRGADGATFYFSSLPPWWKDATRVDAGQPQAAPVHVATREGKYELASGAALVITAKPPPRGTGARHFDGRLDWPKSATHPKAESFDMALSEGAPFAVGWRADGQVLWVACGGGDGTDNSIRYIRKLTLAGPGDVDEQSWDAREKHDFGGLPPELRRVFDTLIAPATNQTSALEDDIIRLAQLRLQQIRLQQGAGRVGLLDVIEAEGALAVAEARSDAMKRAEARLATATKILELIEKLHLAGRADVEVITRAKQSKLAAELEIQRLRAGPPAPPAKPQEF